MKSINFYFLLLLLIVIAMFTCYDANPIEQGPLITPYDSWVIIPGGSVLYYECEFASGIEFTGGYQLSDGTITLGPYTIPEGENILFEPGTIFLGDVYIPPGTVLCYDFVLPGGRVLRNERPTNMPSSDGEEWGVIIPSGKNLPDQDNSFSYVPGGTILSGSDILIREDIVFPINTTFSNGWEMPSPNAVAGEPDNMDADRGDIEDSSSDPAAQGSNPQGTIPPNSFPATITERVTIPAGSLFLGSGILDQKQIMQLPVQLTGAVMVRKEYRVPAPGLAVPRGSFLPAGAVIPAGAVLQGRTVFPAGTIFKQGYVDSNGNYNTPSTISSDLELQRGAVLVGETVIPFITPDSHPEGIPDQIYIPAGTALDAGGVDIITALPGLVMAQSSSYDYGESLPSGTIIFGTTSSEGDSLTLPAGTVLYGGYKKGDEITQPLTLEYELTLDFTNGDQLYGGVMLTNVYSLHDITTTDIYTLVPGFRMDREMEIRTPGLHVIAGSAIPSSVLIPEGAAQRKTSDFPENTVFTRGYIGAADPADASGYTQPAIVGASGISLSANNTVIGEVFVPASNSLSGNGIYLAGGTLLESSTLTIQSAPPVVIPAVNGGNTFSNQESLAEGSALMGYFIILNSDITFPEGTRFPSGYILADAEGNLSEIVQPTEITSNLVLPTGSVLPGGAILPAGDGDPLSADVVLNLDGATIPGAIRIDDTTTTTYIMRTPGMQVPANTYIANGANLPAGAAFLTAGELPLGTVFNNGLLTAGGTFTETPATPFTVSAGDMLPDYAKVQADTALAASLYIPAGTDFTSASVPAPVDIAAIVPRNYTLDATFTGEGRLPQSTLLSGSDLTLTTGITFPTGTVFYGGYMQDDGTIIQPTTLTADTTLNIGAQIFSGALLPSGSEEIMPDEFVGSVIVDASTSVPLPGMELPIGSYLLTTADWEAGATALIDCYLPSGTETGSGYLLNDPNTYTYDTTTPIAADTAFPAGSSSISELRLPDLGAGSPVGMDSLFLPGETVFGNTGGLSSDPAGTIIVQEKLIEVLGGAPYNNITIPQYSRFLGYNQSLANNITFPQGTVFSNGFIRQDGTRVDGSTATSLASSGTLTLNTGDILLGTADLVANEMAIATTITLAGALVLDSGVTQGTGNLILPEYTKCLSGISDADLDLNGTAETTVSAGDVIPAGQSWGVLAGQQYCVPLATFVGTPVAYAKYSSATVEYQTSASISTEVRYSTTQGFDYTNPAEYSAVSDGPATNFETQLTGLSSNTRYFYVVVITGGCPVYTAENVFLTTDPCAGEFELVATAGTDLTTWDGGFGHATTLLDVVLEDFTATDYLIFGSQKLTDNAPDMYESSNFFDIVNVDIPKPSNDMRQVTAVGAAIFSGTIYLYTAYTPTSTKGFLLSRDDSGDDDLDTYLFDEQTLITTCINNAYNCDGFGSNDAREINEMIGGTNFLYVAIGNARNSASTGGNFGKVFLADNNAPGGDGPGGCADFTDSTSGVNAGAGALRDTGGNEVLGTSIDSIEQFNDGTGRLWIGTYNSTGGELFYGPDDGSPTKAELDNNLQSWTPPGTFSTDNVSIEALDEANGYLYLGTENTNGAQLWRCNSSCDTGSNWEMVFDFSTEDVNNTSINWIVYNNPTLYFGTHNPSNGAEVWESNTGESGTWSLVTSVSCDGDGGFGETVYTTSPSAISVDLGGGENVIYVTFQRYGLHTDVSPVAGDDARLYRNVE